VSINCGAIPQHLAESELFGHARGAFTDARESRTGLVSQAHRGTLFLDELTSMSPEIQAKLLRFLQSGEFRAVGSTQTGASDVRVVSACNTPLVLEAREGRFRWDLFYRLGVVTLHIPALRERQDDVPLLLEHFLHHYATKFGLRPARLSPRSLATLMDYPWPGNIRELQNMAQLLSIRCADSWVEIADLPLMNGQEAPVPRRPVNRQETGSYQEERERVLRSFEKTYLVRLLRKHEGNVSAAAREAGKDRRTLTRLLRKHTIDADRFRPGRC
jgi:DNA-binding NtrC family response regulator